MDTRHYVISCDTCGRMRRTNYPKQAPLESITVSETFEIVGMDICGPFPVTSRGNRFILVITDHLSKWAIAVPMAEITTKAIAEVLVNRVILEGNGTPIKILTDRASNFNSELAQEIYELLNISKKTTSAYHPQCDGHTERFNDTLCRTLAKLLQEHALEWDELLAYYTFAYNTAVHNTTKMSPYYIRFGKEPKLPVDYILGNMNKTNGEKLNVYTEQLRERIVDAQRIAAHNVERAQAKQKQLHDDKIRHVEYNKGDLVWIENMTKPPPGTSHKFHDKYLGPYIVKKKTGPSNYVVGGSGLKEQVVHVTRLRKYHQREDPLKDAVVPTPVTAANSMKETPETLAPDPDVSPDSEEGKYPDPIPIEDTHVPMAIVSQRKTTTGLMYLVKYKNGEVELLEESDVPSTLVAKFLTEKERKKEVESDLPHEMIKLFLETIEGFIKQIEKNTTMTVVSIKKKLFGWIKRGGVFFRSARTCDTLTVRIQKAKERDELLAAMREWVDQPNYTFANEWERAEA